MVTQSCSLKWVILCFLAAVCGSCQACVLELLIELHAGGGADRAHGTQTYCISCSALLIQISFVYAHYLEKRLKKRKKKTQRIDNIRHISTSHGCWIDWTRLLYWQIVLSQLNLLSQFKIKPYLLQITFTHYFSLPNTFGRNLISPWVMCPGDVFSDPWSVTS